MGAPSKMSLICNPIIMPQHNCVAQHVDTSVQLYSLILLLMMPFTKICCPPDQSKCFSSSIATRFPGMPASPQAESTINPPTNALDEHYLDIHQDYAPSTAAA
jgi:hypothetical protein